MFKANSELCINCPKMSSVIYPRWRYLLGFLWAIFFGFCWFQTVLFLVIILYYPIKCPEQGIFQYWNYILVSTLCTAELENGKKRGGINEMFIHESSLLNILSETKDCMKKCCNELQESWIFRIITCLD